MIYNGKNLKDFHVQFMDESAFIAVPARSYTTTTVEGRNGDLHFDNGRWENLSVKSNCLILDDIRRYYGELAAFLTQDSSYHRLEGFKEPDYYRLAAVKSVGTPKLRSFARGGLFQITWDCKPLRYLKSGEEAVTFTRSGALLSQWYVPAKPLLRVYGWGTVKVGTGAFEIFSDAPEWIDIDCDIKDAYSGSDNRNSFLSVSEWPTLTEGLNEITIPATVSKIVVTPRWVTL